MGGPSTVVAAAMAALTALSAGSTRAVGMSVSPRHAGGELAAKRDVAARNGLIAYVHDSQIWTANPDGSGQSQLTFGGEGDSFNAWPSWSADGRTLAFVSERPYGISTMNPDGSDVRILLDYSGRDVSVQDPTWSPDGRIAFARSSPGTDGPRVEVVVMNGDGSSVHALPANRYLSGELHWSPDGRSIAFVSVRQKRGIYVMGSDGTRVKRLTRANGGTRRWPDYDTEPSWSPDGKRIVFTRIIRRRGAFCFRIFMIRRDGSDLHKVRSDCPLPDSEPEWSPDGKKILFSTFRPLGPRGRNQLAWMSPSGSSVHTFRVRVYGIDADWQPVPSSR